MAFGASGPGVARARGLASSPCREPGAALGVPHAVATAGDLRACLVCGWFVVGPGELGGATACPGYSPALPRRVVAALASQAFAASLQLPEHVRQREAAALRARPRAPD